MRKSHLSERDCLGVLEQFAKRVVRMGETSSGGMFGEFAAGNQVGVHFLVEGGFGTADELFEAIRVLSGHKQAKPI